MKIKAEIHHSEKFNDEFTLLRLVVDDETKYYTVVSRNGFDEKDNGRFAEIELLDEKAFLGEADFCYECNAYNRKIVKSIEWLDEFERYHLSHDPSLS